MDTRFAAASRSATGPGPGPGPEPPVVDKSLIRANFCGHRDHKGRIVFDPQYFCANEVTADDRQQTYVIKRALGLNAIVLGVPDGKVYGGYVGFTIPDWRQDLTPFKALVDEVLAAGFLPIIFMTSGDNLEALGLYDGELRRKTRVFSGYGKKAWFTGGWEITGSQSPTVSTHDVNLMLKIMHEELGDEALLFVHGADAERCTAASYRGDNPNEQPDGCHWVHGGWVEDNDPSNGGEIDWWYTAEALYCKAWFWQSRHGRGGPSYNDDSELTAWRGRAIECQIRFLAKDNRPPAMNATEPNAPDWMRSRDHNRPIFCVFELEPYEYIREWCDDARVKHVAALLRADGFLHIGGEVAA
jgi:hypothetical protein